MDTLFMNLTRHNIRLPTAMSWMIGTELTLKLMKFIKLRVLLVTHTDGEQPTVLPLFFTSMG